MFNKRKGPEHTKAARIYEDENRILLLTLSGRNGK